MISEEIRNMSSQMLADERKEAHLRKETTPVEVSEKIRQLVEQVGAESLGFLPVIPDEHGLYGWCSDGVASKVANSGGSAVFGWTIWEWPKLFLTAEFHCVWKNHDDRLIDITPKPAHEKQILFASDSTYPQDFDFDDRPRNRRLRSYEALDVSDVVTDQVAGLAGGKLRYEGKRAEKAGMTLEDWLRSKQPEDPLPRALDEWFAVCDEFDLHFDALGTSGHVRADEKLVRLSKRRLALQRRVKKLSQSVE